MPTEGDQPQSRTFEQGLDFVRENHGEDNWFLQIETFDPHEPFFTHEHYKDLYPDEYVGPHFDWPKAGPADRDPALRGHTRYQYAALVSMCDRSLGRVLDAMDRYGMWEDTMLIVTTDHGFLLGEHDLYGKRAMPWYNEIAQIPLFVWDPRVRAAGEARSSLTQTIDLAPTILEFFDVPRPERMQGRPLRPVLERDAKIRDAALFGLFGGHVNCTDGNYMYMRSSLDGANQPLFRYTLMPMHMAGFYALEELSSAELTKKFDFTRNAPVLKVPSSEKPRELDYGTLLFDLNSDPGQEQPIEDPEVEERMITLLRSLLEESEAPAEQYIRLGLQ